MTKQEQIEKLAQLIGSIKDDCENCDCKSCEVNGEDCCCVHYICATFLVDAGYGDVSEYKAEIERLRQEVRDTDKMARNTIEQYRAKNEELENALKQSEDNYSRAFERLKAQQREIKQLKAENDTNMQYIRMMGIQSHIKTSNEQVKQAKIDILNELEKRARTSYVLDDFVLGSVVFSKDIDELIKEVENE